jgi:hypothetical protein
VPFGIFVEVKTLHASIPRPCVPGMFGGRVTTSRTFSGGALMTMEVWRVALNQDITAEVL